MTKKNIKKFEKKNSTYYTEESFLRNEILSNQFLDDLLALKEFKFKLSLTKEVDNSEYWTNYLREKKSKQQANNPPSQHANSAPIPAAAPSTSIARGVNLSNTAVNKVAAKPLDSTTDSVRINVNQFKQELKQIKQENVELKVKLEKVTIEKQNLQTQLSEAEKTIKNLTAEVEFLKKHNHAPSPVAEIPTLTKEESESIKEKLQQTQEDSVWVQSVFKLNEILTSSQSSIHTFLNPASSEVPATDPSVDLERSLPAESLSSEASNIAEHADPAPESLPQEANLVEKTEKQEPREIFESEPRAIEDPATNAIDVALVEAPAELEPVTDLVEAKEQSVEILESQLPDLQAIPPVEETVSVLPEITPTPVSSAEIDTESQLPVPEILEVSTTPTEAPQLLVEEVPLATTPDLPALPISSPSPSAEPHLPVLPTLPSAPSPLPQSTSAPHLPPLPVLPPASPLPPLPGASPVAAPHLPALPTLPSALPPLPQSTSAPHLPTLPPLPSLPPSLPGLPPLPAGSPTTLPPLPSTAPGEGSS